jgi:hypothetical protein
MMRLHITAEGQTEELFVNRILRPHLAQYGVYADVRCILTRRAHGKQFKGGVSTYQKAKNDIKRWLNEEKKNVDVAFTTMFDYYALPNDFPGYKEAQKQNDPYLKVDAIEQAFAKDIDDKRFIPYIQLHEFETLLFVKPEKFEIEYFDKPDGITKLQAIANDFGNPELINQGKETAPSKRIISIYNDYEKNKPAVGLMIANAIGVDAMRESCSHFNDWLTKLEQLG